MKKSFNSLALLALTGAAVMSSCSKDTDLYDSSIAQKEYEQSWTETFGQVAADQDWNLATRATANVNLDGTYDVKIYSANPISSESYLMAHYTVDGTKTFSFDAPKTLSSVFVTAEDAKGNLAVNSYVSLDNGSLTIDNSTRAAVTRAEACNVTVGTSYTNTIRVQVKDGSYTWDEAVKLKDKDYWKDNGNNTYTNAAGETSSSYPNPYYSQYNQWRPVTATFTELDNNKTEVGPTWHISDIVPIVGTNGKFKEGSNNRELYKDVFEKDVVYETNGEPISVTFQFGGTAYYNKFAYYYWKDGEDPAAATRYILMEDARPNKNVLTGDDGKSEVQDGMSWPSIVSGYENGYKTDQTMVGTTYKLVYFDEFGNASYEFPAKSEGYHVAFDMISTGQNSWPTSDKYLTYSLYSVRDHNKAKGKYYGTSAADGGEVSAVTYKMGSNIIMGFEDGSDKDMNDILFIVKGVDPTPVPVIPTPEVKDQSWIIACEDLGSSEDIDFNDVVVKVSYVAGQKTLKLTPLAAGGTLKAEIAFQNWSGEIHELLGGTAKEDGSYDMINTSGSGNIYDASSVTSQEIPLGITEDFTLSNVEGGQNMGGFTITVSDTNGATNSIKYPEVGSIPQMFCIKGDWNWPTERTNIKTAYPNFLNWVSNAANYEWYK